MTHFDIFNGDADGLCALHQLRLANPRDSVLITGVKRDINLVRQVDVASASSVTVLDVSMDKNREALLPLLAADIPVEYFDHHFAGDIPDSSALTSHIDTDANTCTGLIVNRQLGGEHLAWAVTAAFGDNLLDAARQAAQPLHLSEEQLGQLEVLGTLLNYNGYGSSLEDLYFPPAQLYHRLKPYADPFEFIANDPAFETLQTGYAADMQRARETPALFADAQAAAFVFPEDPFARRVSGVYANLLAQENPDRAHAMLSTLPDGAYLVSVRAPLNNKTGADDLCRQFDTGGGRKAAAGINHLAPTELPRFQSAFQAQWA